VGEQGAHIERETAHLIVRVAAEILFFDVASRGVCPGSVIPWPTGPSPHAFECKLNEHSTSAAEMLAQFAKENSLVTIIGAKTPGRLTSRSAFKIGHDYRLVLPIAAYQSWKGIRIEGKGVEPDVEVNWSFEDAVAGRDRQLDYALRVVNAL
jgi:hypothetical protein